MNYKVMPQLLDSLFEARASYLRQTPTIGNANKQLLSKVETIAIEVRLLYRTQYFSWIH